MEQAIETFNEQFRFEPEIGNRTSYKRTNKYLVTGMGGSHLAADLIQAWDPKVDLVIHQDYRLPELADLRHRMVICSSYSGNTEEVIDGFNDALRRNLNVATLSIGGKLLELAERHKRPYVRMPDTGIQPRSALGFSTKGLLKLMSLEDELKRVSRLSELNPGASRAQGRRLATQLAGYVPIIYSSTRNRAIAYDWKIKLNETGKIPAFYNVLPELNHNEMTGFDTTAATKGLSKRFHVLLLQDSEDHPKIIKRMSVLAKLYLDRGLRVEPLKIEGKDRWHKIFSSLILADWVSFYTARHYGVEAEQVPMVEEFKRLIS